jgi:LysM repeat protein/ABC-type branched-subunit amino acid transport system substrate-binding protein
MGVKMKSYALIILFFLLGGCFTVIAQEDLKIETINGKKYYLHTVEQGHTLYAISKKYILEVEEILNENPESKAGLKPGMVLKIPITKDNKKLHKINNPDIQGNYVLHTVEQGQTLYNLSKLYSIDIADIVEANPGVQNQMQAGQVIKIPVQKVKNVSKEAVIPAPVEKRKTHIVAKGETLYAISKKYEVSPDSLAFYNKNFPQGLREGDTIVIPGKNSVKDVSFKSDTLPYITYPSGEYKIALLMPFFIRENENLAANRKPNERETIFPGSKLTLEFYEGFLLALDSLKSKGFNIKLLVYDTEKDVQQLKKVLQSLEVEKPDLMVGPFYLSGFEIASEFAKNNKIPVISPFIQQKQILKSSPYTIKVLPALETQYELLAEYIASSFPGQNVLMVHNPGANEKAIATAFSNKIKELGVPLKEIIYSTSGISGVQASMQQGKTNIIVVPSNEQSFLVDFTSKLYFSRGDKKIILVGTENWLNFQNLDLVYLQTLNTHYPLTHFADYESEEVKNFLKKYREKYFSEPSEASFRGYDVAMAYLNMLNRYGKGFIERGGQLKHTGLHINFNHQKTGADSGLENKSISLIKYEDFKAVKVN